MLGNGFNDNEVKETLKTLEKYGVFVVIISETLGIVKGKGSTTLRIDETFLTSSLYLLDSLYAVGGSSKK